MGLNEVCDGKLLWSPMSLIQILKKNLIKIFIQGIFSDDTVVNCTVDKDCKTKGVY